MVQTGDPKGRVKRFTVITHTFKWLKSYFIADWPLFLTESYNLLLNTGTGKSGKSIWGKKFADELSPSLRVSLGVDTLYTYANNSNEQGSWRLK